MTRNTARKTAVAPVSSIDPEVLASIVSQAVTSALVAVLSPEAPASTGTPATRKAPAKRKASSKAPARKAAPKKPLSSDVAFTGTASDRKRWNSTFMALVKTSGIKVPGAGNHGTLYGFVTSHAWASVQEARTTGKTPAQALDLLVDLSNEWLDAQN